MDASGLRDKSMVIMRIYLSLWCRWSRTGSYSSVTGVWPCTELREPESYATLVDGEPVTQTWSIGPPLSPVLGFPVLRKPVDSVD